MQSVLAHLATSHSVLEYIHIRTYFITVSISSIYINVNADNPWAHGKSQMTRACTHSDGAACACA